MCNCACSMYLQLIYQLLYKESSSPGTLYQLRNAVNRRDVSGAKEDVIKNFRLVCYVLPHGNYLLGTYLAHACLRSAMILQHFPQFNHSFFGSELGEGGAKQLHVLFCKINFKKLVLFCIICYLIGI